MLRSCRYSLIFALPLVGLFGRHDPASALTLRVAAAGQTLEIEDGGKFDREKQTGTIRYEGGVGEVEVRLLLVEQTTPAKQHSLTLSGVPGGEGPLPALTNAGEPGEIAVTFASSRFEAIGPRTRTAVRYQGQITDVEDARLALEVPENRLSATAGGKAAGEIRLAPVQSEGEESNFDSTSEAAELDGEVTNLSAVLRVNLGSGDALAIDEARVATTALAADTNLASLFGFGAAAVVILAAVVLFLRPRARR
ncbi:hypothetical protein [Gloeobacter violaceus]|uniref:Glr3005 protein n=1 Tax=Gloeobacter violaceus (strain ATCC 29082 / PCC 7421) TaxID=251221 RepID=Q7NCH4_GLOVI|nr:hypothetical protein [Gloeobacter violaceus]BAC90946.1 glr3005 [Gloeobacter violaceus PCC 7421]